MNKKYCFIAIGISFIFIGIILTLVILNFSKEAPTTNTIITSKDNKFTIEIPNSISYQMNSNLDEDFVIDLYSAKDEMFFYASTIEKTRIIDLQEIAFNDKQSLQKNKQNIQNDTGLIETKVANFSAYEYHFTYTNSDYGKDFYTTVLWIETSSHLYILNLEVIQEHQEKYEDIFLKIKNSFTEL